MDINVYKVNNEPFCVKEVLKSLESVSVPVDNDAFPSLSDREKVSYFCAM
jgi:hypothetical protein